MWLGHQWLKREIGVVPKIGWMMDSFGHSSGNAALFADFGFDAMFFTRMDGEQKEEYKKTGDLQFIWRPFAEPFG